MKAMAELQRYDPAALRRAAAVVPDIANPSRVEKSNYCSLRDEEIKERAAHENTGDKHQRVRHDPEGFACRTCSSPVPELRVFCPQCGAFQGRTMSCTAGEVPESPIKQQGRLSHTPDVYFGEFFTH